MAVIRLELEVDSEVYPELHAALQAIGNPAARGERFRQLAATGLVWETVRIHGASVTRIQAAPARAPAPALAPSPARGAVSSDRIGSQGVGRTAEKRAARPGNRIDIGSLALNVPPLPVHADDPRDPRTRHRDPDASPQRIPMLLDVVNPPPAVAAPVQLPAPRAGARVPPPSLQDVSLPRPTDASTPDDNAGAPDSTLEQVGVPAPDTGLSHKTGVRSRLLRMREMGLFKNG